VSREAAAAGAWAGGPAATQAAASAFRESVDPMGNTGAGRWVPEEALHLEEPTVACVVMKGWLEHSNRWDSWIGKPNTRSGS
jgi:hypothetical protein